MSFPRDRFDKYLEHWLKEHSCAESSRLQESILYSVFSGGKRLRPKLLWLIGQDFNINEITLFQLGGAVELAHAFSLVHDDLPEMDNDQWRRGKETTHRRFGPAMALMAGDALLALSYELLASACSDQPMKASGMIQTFSQALGPIGMIGGQALEIENPTHKQIHLLKTGALFSLSFKLPAIFSGQDSTELTTFGNQFGIMYQWLDDIQDLAQDQGASKNQVDLKKDSMNSIISELNISLKKWAEIYPHSKIIPFINEFLL